MACTIAFDARIGSRSVQRLLVCSFFVLVCSGVRAQVAAEETLRLSGTLASPWGAPLGKPMPMGTSMQITATALNGPWPLQCQDAKYAFVRTPAKDLFEGNLPAPAEQSVKSLGMVEGIVTQRTICSSGGFDIHRSTDGRAWIGLDNAVLQWTRVDLTSSPIATVQSLLVNHMSGDMALSAEHIAAQSRWLSTSLVDAFKRWFARSASSDEAPALDGDPYTDSQEPPDTFELAPAHVQGNRAEVVVTFSSRDIAAYPVTVQLVFALGEWRIEDLRYRDGQRLSQLLAR